MVLVQVKSGLRRAGGWLLGIGWLGLVYFGLIEVSFSQQAFSEGHHPHRVVGYGSLVVAGIIMIATAEYWKRVFPGIMLAAILNSVLELLRGHAVNNPSVPIAPSVAAIHLLVTVGVTALTLTFKDRKLTMLDRIVLLVFVAAFFWQAVDSRFASVKLLAGAFCILIAWMIDRYKNMPSTRQSPTPSANSHV